MLQANRREQIGGSKSAGIKLDMGSNYLLEQICWEQKGREQKGLGNKKAGIKYDMGSKKFRGQIGWDQIGGIKKAGVKSAVSNCDTTHWSHKYSQYFG